MADKTQNIVINYKFNTAELERATAILNRVNQSSNNLQESGQKIGQGITNGIRQAQPSIAKMQIDLARLKTQIEVSSDPSRVKALSDQYKSLEAQLKKATQAAFGTADAAKKVASSTSSLTSQFQGLYSAVKTVFAAGMVKEFLDIAFSAATLTGRIEGVERAFNRAFPNAVQLLVDLRNATHGTVTDFELMQRTLQATNLGVGVEQLPKLFEFATARAQQTGEAVDYLVDSIVRGIGRKSALILDNLGISAIRLKQELGGVSLQAASVGQVTEAVGKIAEEELGKMGGYAVTAATKVEQLNTKVEQLKQALAKKITSNFLLDASNYILEGFEALIKGEKQLTDEENKRRAAKQVDAFIQREDFKAQKDNAAGQIDLITQEIIERQRLIRVRQQEIDINLAKEKALREDLTIFDINTATEGILKQVDAQKQSKATLEASIPILVAYIKKLREAADVEKDPGDPSGIISRKEAEIKKIEEQIKLTNNLNDLGRAQAVDPNNPDDTRIRSAGRLVVQLEILKGELADLQKVYNDFKPVKFDDVLGTTEAEKAAIAFDKLDDNVKKSLKNISNDLKVGTEDIKAQADLDIPKIINDELNRPQRPNQTVVDISFFDNLKETFLDNWQDITAEAIDIQADAFKSLAQHDVDVLNFRLKNLKTFYDEQQLLAGDNQRYQSELRVKEERETTKLRNELARKEKQARKTQVIIDTAAGIGKAFATAPNIYIALIQAALVAAQGAVQLRTIERQPTNFAKGVIDLKGPGTATSDSIPANLSRGESVMTAWETKNAGNVLKEVRSKKLDNKVLRELKQGRQPIQSQQFDDSKIIHAIEKNRPPDVVEQSNIVYKVTKYSEEYARKVRAKSIHI